MDPRSFQDVASRLHNARAARTRVVDLHANMGPVSRFLLTLAGFVIGIVLILLLIPIFLLAIVFGVVMLAVIGIRRKLRAIGGPNSRVAGVRTDGRENVRVVTRD
ncbi:MAG: hypothetical protein AAF937_09655 [Planctomycetota bacterium]